MIIGIGSGPLRRPANRQVLGTRTATVFSTASSRQPAGPKPSARQHGSKTRQALCRKGACAKALCTGIRTRGVLGDMGRVNMPVGAADHRSSTGGPWRAPRRFTAGRLFSESRRFRLTDEGPDGAESHCFIIIQRAPIAFNIAA